ncbi:colicin E5-related ribonuclease [[Flexibacter] sp. ATCC 35208]|uniref:colicin E5-related ribonuclease n=1 Tax=[Flexibacter] sp. ATCC 35208 TaxID=1936242 RepID=UPI0015C33FBF|nr:colicin E5-related ribonuclease [[Flexibacter] sp. ATCC 35208]
MTTLPTNVEDAIPAADLNMAGLGVGKYITFTRGKKSFELTNHLGNVLAPVSDRKIGVSTNNSKVDYYKPILTSAQEYYPFGMSMPGRGGHIGTGKNIVGSTVVKDGNTIPATLTVTQRTNNTPGTYMATQVISFEDGFTSGSPDEFTTLFVDQSNADRGTESGVSYGIAASGYRYGFNGKENDNDVKGEGNELDYGMRVYDSRIGKFLSVDPLATKFPHYTPYQFSGNTPIQAVDLDGREDIHYIFVWLKTASGKETVLKLFGWSEGEATGKVDKQGRLEYDRPYRVVGHYPAKAFGQTIFVNAEYKSEAEFSHAKASDFYASTIVEGSGKAAEFANDFGFALNMGFVGASLGKLSKQLITEYVETKTAQYTNALADKAVLNKLVEANIQQTLEKANLNGATAVNKYAELKAFAESGRATSVYGIINKKIADQMLYGKLTGELIDETILHPYTTRVSTNKATGVESTVFYQENGSYVIRENNANKIIQISDRTVPDWIPDDNIINPYIPKK